jgi:p-hydroxybenzoate 3-monooxygenase
MTRLPQAFPGAFDRQRQLAELTAIVDSEHGSRFLAETYTGWPTT